MALGLAEHRGRKKRTTWAVFKRTLGRKPSKGQMLQPSYLPPCRSCCHHAFHHTVHAMCMHRLARTMGSRQSSIVCFHFPPQVSKPAPGVAIIHIKDPEELNLQQVSVELCFFFEVIKSHDQWRGNVTLLWFDGGSSTHCLSTLYCLAFEFAGHNKALHVHRSARRIN